MIVLDVFTAGLPATVSFVLPDFLYSLNFRYSKTATIIERPSSARIWQPLVDDRPKDTSVPNRSSTADLSSAWHTRLDASSSESELDGELLEEVLVGAGTDPLTVGAPVSSPPPVGTSAAIVPDPE